MTNTTDNSIVGTSIDRNHNEAHTIEEYWTEERRAAAKPIPFPKVKTPEHPAHVEPPHGEAGHTSPVHGETDTANAAHVAEPHGVGGAAVGNPLAFPYSACGKVFFTQGGQNWVGSASMVSPIILLTAGHCVFENGGWSSNFVFYPSYPKRAATDPFYKFSYNSLAAWTAWTKSGNRAFDYGMAWFDTAPGSKVGGLGLLWNASTAGRVWHAVGYPESPNPPFSGNAMDEAIGTVASSGTAGTIGLANDNMESGSSGGPWITNFNSTALQYANGLQSFHTVAGSSTEYGPVFTADVKGLYDWISNPANR